MVGLPSAAFTATANGTLVASVVVTPNDAGGGGTFAPTQLTLGPDTPAATFSYTPATAGTKTVAVTNNAGLTNPTALAFVSSDGSLPAWLLGVAVDQWVEVPNSSMSVVPTGMVAVGTTPSGRMDAWNGYAIHDRDVYSVRQGGHGDYYGNEVLRFNLGSDTPTWMMIKDSTPDPAVVTDNQSRYTDGTPAAVHGYYTQRYVAARNWVLSVGTTAMSLQGGTNNDCVVYDISTNAYLPVGTVPDATPSLLPGFGVFDDPVTEDIFHVGAYTVNRWNQVSNTWTFNVGSLEHNYGFPSTACTDTNRRRAVILSDSPGATQSYLFDIVSGNTTPITFGDDPGFATGDHGYGMTFCPPRDRFYVMVGNMAAAGDLYEVNPETFVISPMVTTGAGAMPATAGNGVWGRFTYVPSLGGIIYFPRYVANAWFLRLH